MYPVPDASDHAFASLGTHLTLDLAGNVRFGPDLEWVSAPDADEMAKFAERGEEDRWWESALVTPELSEERREVMHRAIVAYLSGVEREGLNADYTGIRPKLVGPDGGFQDFVVKAHGGDVFGGGSAGRMISLFGKLQHSLARLILGARI